MSRINPKAIAGELRALNDEYEENTLGVREPLLDSAADTIDTLVKQLADADRQFTALKESSGKSDARAVELAAVVEKVWAWNAEHGFGWAEGIDEILSAAPADALAEHDARLIEGLAEDLIITADDDAPTAFVRGMDYAADEAMAWLRGRARLIREGGES